MSNQERYIEIQKTLSNGERVSLPDFIFMKEYKKARANQDRRRFAASFNSSGIKVQRGYSTT